MIEAPVNESNCCANDAACAANTHVVHDLIRSIAYLLAAGEAAGTVVAEGEACGAGVGVAVGALSGVDCNTEREPDNDCSDSVNAISIKAIAAPIVIFANRLAVPLGPNAVLERLLEKSAPASALPGCNRIVTIRTTQLRMKSPYKIYVTKSGTPRES